MDTERLLRELLAVIHGDGGHHAHQHGLEESCRQAHLSLTRLRDELHRLRWGVAANAGCRSTEPAPRWAHVVDMTGLGSTSAQQLCHAAGFDPDEIVGKAQEYLGVALAESDQREHAAALTMRMQELEAAYVLKVLEAEERGAKWAIDERGLHAKRDTRPMARELCERMRRAR